MPPLKSSHPVPARNPPTTGYGMNRTRLPSRNVPSTRKMTPQSTVTTSVAATTVRKTSGTSHSPTDAVWQSRTMFAALYAVLSARIESTAAAASCTLPTTPRMPALHARNPSVSAAATRYRPMPSPRRAGVAPANTRAANATASTASTAPMIKPGGERRPASPADRRCSDTSSLPCLVEQGVELPQRVAQPFRQGPREPPVQRRGQLGLVGLHPLDRRSR